MKRWTDNLLLAEGERRGVSADNPNEEEVLDGSNISIS
jgi:hypothetical protein